MNYVDYTEIFKCNYGHMLEADKIFKFTQGLASYICEEHYPNYVEDWQITIKKWTKASFKPIPKLDDMLMFNICLRCNYNKKHDTESCIIKYSHEHMAYYKEKRRLGMISAISNGLSY